MSSVPDSAVSNAKFADRLDRQANDGHGWDKVPEMMREAARRLRVRPLALTRREHAAVLTGLRLYEALQHGRLNAETMGAVQIIATNCGTLKALSGPEADQLCMRINSED